MLKRSSVAIVAVAGVCLGVTSRAAADPGDAGLSADETRALVAEMMADVDRRSSASSMPGWDTESTVEVTGAIQFRYIANFGDEDADDPDAPDRDDFEAGFQFASTEFMLSGTVGDDGRWSYLIQALVNPEGDFNLDDVFIKYRVNDRWSLDFGQIAVPFWRELLIDDVYQLAVDRSLLFANTGPILTQGVSAIYQDDTLRGWFQVSDGIGGQNTVFTDDADTPFFNPGGGESDYAVTGRIEYKGAGQWDQFTDFTSAPGSEFAWLLGAAVAFEGGETDVDDNDYTGLAWTLDLSLEGDAWNAYAAYVGYYSDIEQTAPADDIDAVDHGVLVQGGFFIPDTDWELFARYDALFPDGDRENDDVFNTITLGANYYIHGHAVKFTADVQWSLDPATDNDLVSNNLTRFGFIGDDDENEIAARAQLQLMF
jgi:hypothetical protein